MQVAAADTARAVVAVSIPREALPPSVLIALLFVFGGLLGYAMYKAPAFSNYAGTFPTQKATVMFGLGWGTYIVAIAGARLALGMAYPGGYGDIAILIGTVTGVGGAWGASKHAFSVEREEAKGAAAAKIAAATPTQPTQVLAAKGSTVSVSTEAESPSGAAADDGAVG